MTKTKLQPVVKIKQSANPFSEIRSCTKVDRMEFVIKINGQLFWVKFAIEYFEDEDGARSLEYIEVEQPGVKGNLCWHGASDSFSFLSLFKDYTSEILKVDRQTLSKVNHSVVDIVKKHCKKKHITGMH